MLLTGLGAGGYFFWDFYRVKPIPVKVITLLPVWEWKEGRARVTPVSATGDTPARLVAEVEYFHDEFFAYLSFDFLRSRAAMKGRAVYLVAREQGPRVVYHLRVDAGDDWLRAYDPFVPLNREGLVRSWLVSVLSPEDQTRTEAETRVFVSAYNRPVQARLEELSPAELRKYARRFLLFKSRVDPRIRKQMEPRPSPITPDTADQLAADIIAVARFYDLPLDVFLGIAAVENNYMDVRGDLQHGIWKRKAERGDLVLRRGKRGVYVLNDATGVWQITRETLRFAHRIYLQDRVKGTRDYEALPGRLIPQETLYLDEVNSHWLTLYAGVLVRYLLDHFGGDIEKAVGAYNGGIGRPNARYGEHVEAAARHARRVLEQAAALHGMEMREANLAQPEGGGPR